MTNDNILEVRDLKVYFPVKSGVFGLATGCIKAVDGVSFDLKRGETLGVVGESGCGKSTTSRAILGLNRITGGTIRFGGRRLRGRAAAGETDEPLTAREAARKIQVVFQDPQASLNPRHTVMEILTEALVYHGLCKKAERRERAAQLLDAVGMPGDILERYPHEFSGGQRQRLCIARAVALKPELLICDEAVSALDLSIRAQVLDLLAELKSRLGLSMIFITHDIGVVQHVADRIIVMHRGRIVEQGPCAEVLGNPREEYTRYLMAAVPRIGKPLA